MIVYAVCYSKSSKMTDTAESVKKCGEIMARTRKRKSKPYVRYSTVNKAKNKCNKMSGNGSSDVCIVGRHKLLVTRSKNGYDKNGKPVNSATLIRTDGTPGATYPAYNYVLKRKKARHSDEILKLTDELLNETQTND